MSERSSSFRRTEGVGMHVPSQGVAEAVEPEVGGEAAVPAPAPDLDLAMGSVVGTVSGLWALVPLDGPGGPGSVPSLGCVSVFRPLPITTCTFAAGVSHSFFANRVGSSCHQSRRKGTCWIHGTGKKTWAWAGVFQGKSLF